MLLRETFSNSIDLEVINEYDKAAVMEISTVLWHVYHVACQRVLSNGVFRHWSDYVFRVRNFKITKSIRESFFWKCLKFHLGFGIAARNGEKNFCFWDNCIWIGTVKLSLLRRGYFSSTANVFKSSTNIWHVNNGDFFQLNWLFSDQSIG